MDDPNRKISLMGLMGSGKTAIGRKLAHNLGYQFVDTDHEIECQNGLSIADIFEKHGEEAFRKSEARIVKECVDKAGRAVLSLGGGAVVHPQSLEYLRRHTQTIWIKSDIDEILKRIGNDTSRPLLACENPKATLEKLLRDRSQYYEQASIHIDNDGSSLAQIVKRIEEKIT